MKENLKSGDCVKILANCIQYKKKQVKELHLRAQRKKDKHINGKSILNELTKAINFNKIWQIWKKKTRGRQNHQIYKNRSVWFQNLENQLDRQEQYSCRSSILSHSVTGKQNENTDDFYVLIKHQHLELELTQTELDHTDRISHPESGNKRFRAIMLKFEGLNHQMKVFIYI